MDPTVGEWKRDPSNPNYPALQDVGEFVLPDSPTVYYIKLRPGTREFLKKLTSLYELHIYTMGTRNYANAVAAIIDPKGEIFRERILSRDESGSFTQKSIQRLFPCDQSMVVVIDDRADVWAFSPNLIKIRPYEFFVGIGDINASVYKEVGKERRERHERKRQQHQMQMMRQHNRQQQPQQQQQQKQEEQQEMTPEASISGNLDEPDEFLDSILPPPTPVIAKSNPFADDEEADTNVTSTMNDDGADDEKDGEEEEEEDKSEEETQQTLRRLSQVQQADLDSQIKDRPLLREWQKAAPTPNSNQQQVQPQQQQQIQEPPSTPLAASRPVLLDNDTELELMERLLLEIYDQYYSKIPKSIPASDLTESPSLRSNVQTILPGMKREVLRGCRIVFSSLIPINEMQRNHWIWRVAEQFGATCCESLTDNITHVVAAKRGTDKVNRAKKMKNVNIVIPEWLYESVAQWCRLPERQYLLEPELAIDMDRLLPATSLSKDLERIEKEKKDDVESATTASMEDADPEDLEMLRAPTSAYLAKSEFEDMYAEIMDAISDDEEEEDEDEEMPNATTKSDKKRPIEATEDGDTELIPLATRDAKRQRKREDNQDSEVESPRDAKNRKDFFSNMGTWMEKAGADEANVNENDDSEDKLPSYMDEEKYGFSKEFAKSLKNKEEDPGDSVNSTVKSSEGTSGSSSSSSSSSPSGSGSSESDSEETTEGTTGRESVLMSEASHGTAWLDNEIEEAFEGFEED